MAATEVNFENLLLKVTSLSEVQLKALLDSPVEGAANLGSFLGMSGDTQAEEILSKFCQKLGFHFIKDIPVNDIPMDMIRHIPINYAKTKEILPAKEDQNFVYVYTTNPLNFVVFDDLRTIFKKDVVPLVVAKNKLIDAINRLYEKGTAALEGLEEIEGDDTDLDESIVDLLESDDEAPVIKLVNTLLSRAVKEKASDIHIEPYEREMVVRFRIDGILYDIYKPPKKLQNAITSRIKVMGNLNIAEKRLPQDGRIPLRIGGKDIDVRLNTVPTAFGERLVMRLQDRSNVILSLEQLGFSEENLVRLTDLISRTYGILLVTGPTGSGKSTTLYACLQRLNSVESNIITVEDPVEQRIAGIGQIQVNSKIGLTFGSGLRAILRQDPDIIMIGEIRDLETAEIAINSSLTGHLVLSTIHTNDAAGAFPRLTDIGCEPFLIATSLLGVISQRLVRVLCPHCKQPHTPTDTEIANMEIAPEVALAGRIHRAVGCDKCNYKGYLGRTLIQELLVVSEEIRSLVMQRKDSGTIKKMAIDQGMKTFRDHGIEKVLNGITTIEEVLSNTQTDL
ncbi:MAG: type II secretion system ATPase GspE [Bdellovibrionaceae bacterium]|nr:type II secretion system ATPase GspE [Pseudobdellovibrionaceae bacterium]